MIFLRISKKCRPIFGAYKMEAYLFIMKEISRKYFDTNHLTSWLLILFFVNFSLMGINGQSSNSNQYKAEALAAIDSLKGEARIEAMIDLAYYYYDYVPDSTLHFADQALMAAKKIKYLRGEISIEALKGSFKSRTGDYSGSKLHYKKALELNAPLKNEIRAAKIRDNLANVFIDEGNFKEALDIKKNVFETFQEQGDSTTIFNSALGLGNLFKELKDLSGALTFYNLALNHATTSRNKALILGNLAIVYKKQGELDKAFDYYHSSLEYGKEMPIFKIRTYQNLAIAYNEIGDPQLANKMLDEALLIAIALKDTLVQTDLKITKAFNLLSEKRFKASAKLVHEIEPQIVSSSITQQHLDFLQLKKNLARETSNFRDALALSDSFYLLKDSIQDIEVKKELKVVQTKFQVAEKNKQISEQKFLLGQETERRKRIISWSIFALSLAAFLIWTLSYRNKLKNRLAEKDRLLQQEKILQLEQEKKLLTISSMVEGQEQERIRIARDLHDSLGSLMAAMKSHVANIYNELKKIEEIKFDKNIDVIIDEASSELRRIAYNMSPTTLANLGLEKSVQDLVMAHNAKEKFELNFQWIGEELEYDKNRDLMIYRIVQEILNNASKHSQANNIVLQVSNLNSEIQLIYQDDGQGFDSKNVLENANGMGFKSLKSRVTYLSGTFEIDSNIGQGTSIEIHIPKV